MTSISSSTVLLKAFVLSLAWSLMVSRYRPDLIRKLLLHQSDWCLIVITFLTFGEAQIIGGIVPNLIAFGLFLGAIGYFASTGKMAEMFGWKNKK